MLKIKTTGVEGLKNIQSDKWVHELAGKLADNPKIKWKESCKKFLTLKDQQRMVLINNFKFGCYERY